MSAEHADHRARRERALDMVRRQHQDEVDALARATVTDRAASGTIGGIDVALRTLRFWHGDDVLEIQVWYDRGIARHAASIPRDGTVGVDLVTGYLTDALASALDHD